MLAVQLSAVVAMATDPLPPEATVELLDLARRGDASALERLLDRCVPPLQRWAHGRLPVSLRDTEDTTTLVQTVVMAAVAHLDGIDLHHQGALQTYLRAAILKHIRDLDRDSSPVELAIGAENLERYEAAVERLAPADQDAVIGRLELRYSYEALAIALGKPSADAARSAVTRAVKRLTDEMRRDG